MSGPASPSVDPILIVLFAPELLRPCDDKTDSEIALCEPMMRRLRETTARDGRRVRVLIRINSGTQLAFVQNFCRERDDCEILLGSDVNVPDDWPFAVTPMPPSEPSGDTKRDLDEVALALSDVVLTGSGRLGDKLVKRARELGKVVIELGDPLPPLPTDPGVTLGLDPDAPGRRCVWRYVFGWIEQIFLILLSSNWCHALPWIWKWLRKRPDGEPSRREAFKKWASENTHPRAYFPRSDAANESPDAKVKDPNSPQVARFERLDRSALFGSYIHRDQIWVTHILGAFAVIAAVTATLVDHRSAVDAHKQGGATVPSGHEVLTWPFLEFAALGLVVTFIYLARRNQLQDRWTACRMGAEQLRIARMCLPLLVIPRALSSVDTGGGTGSAFERSRDLTLVALSEVKRAVRDHGLPRLAGIHSPGQAARWVKFIVHDQMGYHEQNHTKLERAETRLRHMVDMIFLAVFVAVGVEIAHHFFSQCVPHIGWLVMITAGGPAVAAASHGASIRLGMVQRIALSGTVMRDLRLIHDELTDLTCRPTLTDTDWPTIRSLTFRAAEAMGQENTSWHGQVRLQRDSLPA